MIISNTNTIKRTVEELKTNSVRFRLIPLESTPSLPIPLKIGEKIHLSFLYFTAKKPNKDEEMKIYRPNSKIVVDLQSGRIVKYVALDVFENGKPEEAIGKWPHSEIDSMTLKEYKRTKDELIQKYDKAIDLFKSDSEEDEFKRGFRSLFYKLCEPDLVPYMKKVGKEFFEWLDSE